jgi:hypothetical protein
LGAVLKASARSLDLVPERREQIDPIAAVPTERVRQSASRANL